MKSGDLSHTGFYYYFVFFFPLSSETALASENVLEKSHNNKEKKLRSTQREISKKK